MSPWYARVAFTLLGVMVCYSAVVLSETFARHSGERLRVNCADIPGLDSVTNMAGHLEDHGFEVRWRRAADFDSGVLEAVYGGAAEQPELVCCISFAGDAPQTFLTYSPRDVMSRFSHFPIRGGVDGKGGRSMCPGPHLTQR